MADAAPTPLHQALRAATIVDHRRLDHHPLLAPLVAPQPTLADYRRALSALLWLHAALQEPLRAELRAWAIAYPLLDRVALLRADLAALKVSPIDTALAPPALPAAGSAAVVLGRLYVLEGSRLGGRTIARCLQDRLGLDAGNGAGFFVIGAADIERDWAAFWQLCARLAPPKDEVIAGARAMFQYIANRLDDWQALIPAAATHAER